VIRPDIDTNMETYRLGQGYMSPPISPRDFMCMIDDKMYYPGLPNKNHAWADYCKDAKIQKTQNFESMSTAEQSVHREAWKSHEKLDQKMWNKKIKFFDNIFWEVLNAGNDVVASPIDYFNSSFVTRLDGMLILGTQDYYDDNDAIHSQWKKMFPDKNIHVKSTEGHSDGVFCPVTDELIVTAFPEVDYSDIFPKAEVVVVPQEVTLFDDKFKTALHLSEDKWLMPNMEHDKKLVDMVDHYFSSWVGSVAESSFMVNILMLDEKNAVCSTDNKDVREAMKRHGVELHVVPFRHKYFWDTGINCLTQDLDRE